MNKRAEIITEKSLHEGYLKLCQYDISVESMKDNKKSFHLNSREILHTPDAVHVLIYLPAEDSFLLGEEFRTGVFLNPAQDNPLILTCVSGAMEKDSRPKENALREVQEETGLILSELQLIASVYKSPGISTEKAFIYFAETKETPTCGIHGLEDEEIRTYLLSRERVYALMDNLKIMDAATLIALNWFRAKQ